MVRSPTVNSWRVIFLLRVTSHLMISMHGQRAMGKSQGEGGGGGVKRPRRNDLGI